MPREVSRVQGDSKFLKPAYELREFRRKVDSFWSIDATGLTGKIRVPHRHGIVVSQNGETTLGLSFDWIEPGRTLRSQECRDKSQLHAK